MTQRETIEQFYTAFSNGNVDAMLACYHSEIQFEDPAFGKLSGERAKAMWQMLLSKQKESKLSVAFELDQQSNNKAKWIANYQYGPKKRKVINHVSSTFQFKDGKIIKHTDEFNLHKWAKQALGFKGFLIGNTAFFQNKLKAQTNRLLDKFESTQ